MPMSHFKGKNVWILKPTGLNRGKGIHVVDSVKEMKRLIKQTCLENAQAKNLSMTNSSLVIQPNKLKNLKPFQEPQTSAT